MDSSSLSVLQYNINNSGVLSALVRCTAPGDNETYAGDNETYVIECGMNGQWNTDITDNCCSSNPNIIQTTISEYYKYKTICDRLWEKVHCRAIALRSRVSSHL